MKHNIYRKRTMFSNSVYLLEASSTDIEGKENRKIYEYDLKKDTFKLVGMQYKKLYSYERLTHYYFNKKKQNIINDYFFKEISLKNKCPDYNELSYKDMFYIQKEGFLYVFIQDSFINIYDNKKIIFKNETNLEYVLKDTLKNRDKEEKDLDCFAIPEDMKEYFKENNCKELETKGKNRILGKKGKKMSEVEIGYISGTKEEKKDFGIVKEIATKKRIIYKDNLAIINNEIVIDMEKITYLNRIKSNLIIIIDSFKQEIFFNEEEGKEFMNQYIDIKIKKNEIL